MVFLFQGYSAFVVEGGDGGGSLGDSSEESHEVKMSAVGSRHRQVTVWSWDKAGAPDHDNPVSKAFQVHQISSYLYISHIYLGNSSAIAIVFAAVCPVW